MTKPTKEVLTGENTVAVQGAFEGMEQDRVPAIESAADKYAEKLMLCKGLKGELKNAEAKLIEAVHLHAEAISRDEEGTLAYVRGDYNVFVSTTEKLKVKIAKDDAEGLDS